MTEAIDITAIRRVFRRLLNFKPRRFSHCGPKNNGKFGYMDDYRFRIGLTHKPMTKINRMAFLTCSKKGWRNA